MRWDGWLFGSTELLLELGAVCQVTNQPAWPRLGQTVWKQSKSLNQSRRSKQPSNSQEWMVFTGIPQISTLRKKRFFNVINFLPLNQWLGRSSHDDRSHHHHPPAIHQAIMIMFCIIRHKTGGQAGPARHRGRAVDRKGLTETKTDIRSSKSSFKPIFCTQTSANLLVDRYRPPCQTAIMTMDLQETQFWLLAVSQFQFVSSVSLVIRHCSPFETSWFFTTRVPAGLFQVIWLLDGWG